MDDWLSKRLSVLASYLTLIKGDPSLPGPFRFHWEVDETAARRDAVLTRARQSGLRVSATSEGFTLHRS